MQLGLLDLLVVMLGLRTGPFARSVPVFGGLLSEFRADEGQLFLPVSLRLAPAVPVSLDLKVQVGQMVLIGLAGQSPARVENVTLHIEPFARPLRVRPTFDCQNASSRSVWSPKKSPVAISCSRNAASSPM
jgi:hypothetical protein